MNKVQNTEIPRFNDLRHLHDQNFHSHQTMKPTNSDDQEDNSLTSPRKLHPLNLVAVDAAGGAGAGAGVVAAVVVVVAVDDETMNYAEKQKNLPAAVEQQQQSSKAEQNPAAKTPAEQ